jgi:hypothetical protein
VKQGATLGNDQWHWWDFRPETTNPAWAGQEFDYPDLEVSDNHLYMTTNTFRIQDEDFTQSVIFRIPLDELAAGDVLNHRHWSSENFSLRCTRGSRDTMYFASHNSLNQVRVFSWPESADDVTFQDVDVMAWSAGAYQAPGPDGANWLGRCDPRITGAWVANGVIGLAWSANQRATRPFPYVRVVRIAADTMTVVDDADIWSANHAYAYPDACPNDRGHVGITLFRGGRRPAPRPRGRGLGRRLERLAAGRDGRRHARPHRPQVGRLPGLPPPLTGRAYLDRVRLHAAGRRHARQHPTAGGAFRPPARRAGRDALAHRIVRKAGI